MEIYSLKEIAAAAGVPVGHVESHVIAGGVPAARGWVVESDAIRLVREIAAGRPAPSSSPAFFAVVKSRPHRPRTGLFASAGLHALVAVLIVSSLAMLGASTIAISDPPPPAHLVFLMTPGPGGGGGGGGVKIPLPTRRAARKAPVIKKVSTPLPEVKPPPPPPEPKADPPPAPPPPVVQAPVVTTPADPVEVKGQPAPVAKPKPADQGAGTGGGAGTGAGQGVGRARVPGSAKVPEAAKAEVRSGRAPESSRRRSCAKSKRATRMTPGVAGSKARCSWRSSCDETGRSATCACFAGSSAGSISEPSRRSVSGASRRQSDMAPPWT